MLKEIELKIGDESGSVEKEGGRGLVVDTSMQSPQSPCEDSPAIPDDAATKETKSQKRKRLKAVRSLFKNFPSSFWLL